ncbi:MAG: hypothetical protein V1904_11445 [Bacteroidota bacterium]
MKKVLAITIVSAFVLTLSLTSCKKDYTCECTFTTNTPITIPLDGYSKKNAEDACDDAEITYSAIAGASCTLN